MLLGRICHRRYKIKRANMVYKAFNQPLSGTLHMNIEFSEARHILEI